MRIHYKWLLLIVIIGLIFTVDSSILAQNSGGTTLQTAGIIGLIILVIIFIIKAIIAILVGIVAFLGTVVFYIFLIIIGAIIGNPSIASNFLNSAMSFINDLTVWVTSTFS